MSNPPDNKLTSAIKWISLKKREIYFVYLKPYSVHCPSCNELNVKQIQCKKCRKPFSLDRVQGGFRPVIIVYPPDMSCNDQDESLVLGIPITGTNKNFPGSVILPANKQTGLTTPGPALVFDLTAYDKKFFLAKNKRGEVGDYEWNQILEKLKIILGIDDNLVHLKDGKVYSLDQIKNILEERDKLLKDGASVENLRKKIDGLERKIESQSGAYDVYKEEQKQKLEKAEKRIRNLEGEVCDLQKTIEEYESRNNNSSNNSLT